MKILINIVKSKPSHVKLYNLNFVMALKTPSSYFVCGIQKVVKMNFKFLHVPLRIYLVHKKNGGKS